MGSEEFSHILGGFVFFFSSLFSVFLFVFLRLSLLLSEDKGKRQLFTMGNFSPTPSWGIYLRPRLHRPRANFLNLSNWRWNAETHNLNLRSVVFEGCWCSNATQDGIWEYRCSRNDCRITSFWAEVTSRKVGLKNKRTVSGLQKKKQLDKWHLLHTYTPPLCHFRKRSWSCRVSLVQATFSTENNKTLPATALMNLWSKKNKSCRLGNAEDNHANPACIFLIFCVAGSQFKTHRYLGFDIRFIIWPVVLCKVLVGSTGCYFYAIQE